ncbi:LOW QUALITY PROTEIN: hypothetical protein CFOL_v3_23578, partial [Cephalotus follicularis]
KYCKFHRDHGHDTENCRHLKDEIEKLIRRGYLRKYVSDQKNGAIEEWNRNQTEEQQHHRRAFVIHVISGGPISGGENNSYTKAYAREALIVDQPLKKTKTINQVITFSEEDMEGVKFPHDDPMVVTVDIANFEVRRVLIDNGNSVNILKMVMINFVVVDVPSSYNTILGRPWQNIIDVVVSTRYLAVKFPTDQGVGLVKGDQAIARQCYFSSIK